MIPENHDGNRNSTRRLTIPGPRIASRPTQTAGSPAGANPHHSYMPEIQVKKGEPIDRALKRLKSKIEAEGVLEEFRRRRQHETPMERSKRKARSAAKKKNQKYRFVP
jgi:small subunit ribosomal protein S21